MVNLKSKSTTVSDGELFSKFVKGDMTAFNKLVNRYQGKLLNFVYRFTGDWETAQDIVQETFVRIYRKRDDYRLTGNLSTWIFTIAGNLAKSELRHRKRWHFVPITEEKEQGLVESISGQESIPNFIAEKKAVEEKIQAAIMDLPPKYREAVILRDIELMSYQQIAEITGCPVGTVKSRVNRGRLKLQKKLKQIIRK